MILAIDIGNTHIVLGGFLSDKICFVSEISTQGPKTSDEFAISILDSLHLYDVDKTIITGVIVASVVPQLNGILKKALETIFGLTPIFVGPGVKSGIGIRCDIPSSVGADLIAACVAVHYLYGSPALIIDIGTATKMTVIDNQGAFIGTSIIPGVLMGLNALATETAQLPQISLEVPGKIIAQNTADCMRSGVLFGNASLIDGMIDRIFEEFSSPLKIYATGGMACTIIPLCKHEIIIDEYLVLKGLNIIYKKNIS